MYENKTQDLITMSKREKCEYCDKEAIGYQGFGCCSAYVCADHADKLVLDLKPGERKVSGECVFERFKESA
jgi:hypothetical protein